MVPDKTGSFPQRPHWEVSEIENKCEEAITGFLIKRYGFARIAVPTEALMELVDHLGADLEFKDSLCRTINTTCLVIPISARKSRW